MSRTRREYAETVGGSITGDGQEWDSATAPNMLNDRTTINYSMTIGSGKTAETFSQLTIWLDGVISLGPATPAQIAFMSHYQGSSIQQFPGYFISAGYTDESQVVTSDGNYDTGYGVEIAQGSIDFTVPFGDPGTAANATHVTRIDWGQMGDVPGEVEIDKQVLLSPTNFMIGDTQYDNQGAGWNIGLVNVFSNSEPVPVVGNYKADYFANVTSDFNGDAHSDLLVQSPTGAVFIGEIGANNKGTYTDVTTLGSQWTFIGSGDFLDEGQDQFLVENTAGVVLVGDTQGGTTGYTQLGTLASGSKVAATGDFLGEGRDQFLIQSSTGALDLGQFGANGKGAYVALGSLGSQWTFVGSGDFLGSGQDQFLIENSSGAVLDAEVHNGKLAFVQIGTLATGWKIDAVGDFLGTEGAGPSLKADLLVQAPGGILYIGEIGPNDKGAYTEVMTLSSGWTVVGAGDYLGEGHDQFLIETSAGALIAADFTGGVLHKTLIADLAAQYTLHG